MTKFLAVLKREYFQRVKSKFFIVATVLGPVMIFVFTVLPQLILSMKSGGPTHIAVIDQTKDATMYPRVADALLHDKSEGEEQPAPEKAVADSVNSNTQDRVKRAGAQMKADYQVEQVQLNGRSLDEVRQELRGRVLKEQLDGYLVIPPNVAEDGKILYYARNLGDVFTREDIKKRLNDAVRNQRMDDNGLKPDLMGKINKQVEFDALAADESSKSADSGSAFWFVFIIGFLIYLTLIMYGQTILAAVIEEKDTRISELLFSSVRSFTLLMGKLIGVSLVALTQYAIWALAFAGFVVYATSSSPGGGFSASLPHIPASLVIYFFLFFIMGYFIYATIYALVGSMVTTSQEGGQVAMPVLFMLIIGFYLSFNIIRSPASPLAFWTSMIPFFSPITMLVRIVSQTPPFWQIALSLAIGFATIVGLMWLAARIYRVGMLMYGKRATIPEVMRWVKQA
ncbi:MAG TPA: ABC transporter permease [Pyrinomonadaceae bacterium]|nr:ABC transporter permease [Pyrinomonadaceae bacterium]